MTGRGAVVVGAGPLGRVIATALRANGRPVVLIDRNAGLIDAAKASGFDAISGNALDEGTLEQAGAEDAETLVAVTTNSEVNALAAHLAHDAFGVARAYPALDQPGRGAGESLLERVGGRLAFGRPVDVRRWDSLLAEARARVIRLDVPSGPGPSVDRSVTLSPNDALPVARIRDGSVEIITAEERWREGDTLVVVSLLSPEETLAFLRLEAADEIPAPAPGQPGHDEVAK